MWPSLSTMPGFSRPGGPKRTSFMGGPLYSGLQACGNGIMRRPRAADKGGSIAGDASDANDPKRASNMPAKVAA
jgi:hypothetical protein